MKGKSVILLLGLLAWGWSATAQEDRSIIRAYHTDRPPTIDGVISPGEWNAAGPPIVVLPDSPNALLNDQIPEDPFGGADDLSYQFRVMWSGDWMVYFLYEVTDDIAMDSDPIELWMRDQVETFIDGNDLAGNPDAVSFHWWASDEPYGKFGVDRYGNFEGHPEIMSTSVDDFYFNTATDFITGAGAAGDAVPPRNANYVVELAVSLEPMYYLGTLNEEHITINVTKIKMDVALSDDDNFTTGTLERSTDLGYYRQDAEGNIGGWDQTSYYPDLVFVDAYTSISEWPLF